MPFIDSKFSNTDNELANFAKALALPVRIAIIRTIMLNGNTIAKENFYDIPFHQETINKHIAELRTLGIIKTSGYKGNIKYSIDEHLFDNMTQKIANLFGFISNREVTL